MKSRLDEINLADIIEELGEERATEILSSFSCSINPDVEDFIRNKSIQFAKQGLASTYLVFTLFRKEKVLVGYYAIAMKTISVDSTALSHSNRDRIKRFSPYDSLTGCYTISAYLLGQLAKNDAYHDKITGDDLISLSLNRIHGLQHDLSGRFTYLECEDVSSLIRFYERHSFVKYGQRNLDDQEESRDRYLVQMLRYK